MHASVVSFDGHFEGVYAELLSLFDSGRILTPLSLAVRSVGMNETGLPPTRGGAVEGGIYQPSDTLDRLNTM
jgi:hypothetical protein